MLQIWLGVAHVENRVGESRVLALGSHHEIFHSRSEEYDLRHRQGSAKMLLEIGLAKSVL